MAVRTPSGTTLPGNLTIIPSEQKWVFHAIYQYVFPSLYSSVICSRNRVVLTDEDDAEYGSFEAVIESMNEFKQSKVMLCTFHAIWMPFKKDLIPLLNDCEHGKIVGKCWGTGHPLVTNSYLLPCIRIRTSVYMNSYLRCCTCP
jgi:hypothetical protein